MKHQFDFHINYCLENDYVLLKPLQSECFEDLLNFSLNEPEIWQYSLMQAHSEQLLSNYIAAATEAREAEREYPFVVYDKTRHRYAGSTRFYDIQVANKCLSLGYTWYGKEFQGTGLNKSCKFLLLQFAFEFMQMERVEFRADCLNVRSIEAMKSIGCTVEGILRSNNYRPDGTRRDSIVLSILKDEWNKTVKDNLAKKINPLLV
jgi:N-acetyltransferase